MKIINGHNAIMGRLSSTTVKHLLKGEEVSIVNAEQVIITGDPNKIVNKYLKMRKIGSPQHGPFYPKKPDAILRRAIRGMMPYKTSRGRAAMKKLRIYVGIPEELKDKDIDNVAIKPVKSNYTRLSDVSRTMGWRE
ncbi:50S ribosomal protein L13 [archaeon]|nr:50S ribosomal protein L13 [archaeon]